MKRLNRLLREPLVHFLAIGVLLFLAFHFWGAGGSVPGRIVITPGQIDSLAAQFLRTWQRPPTELEMKGLIDDYVREEMAAREAMALGLDRDDTIIRRRLRQKLEFLAEDTSNTAPPTDAELQRWLDRAPEAFRAEAQVAFRQVYLDPGRHGQAIDRDVQKLLAQLTGAGPAADIGRLGDPLMLPQEMALASGSEVSRLFGSGFADAILSLEPGRWAGPVRSGYGLHLVCVQQRQAARPPSLDEIRPVVEREFLAERRKRELAAMYERLLERYRVTVAPQAEAQRTGGTAEAAVKEAPR